MSKRSKFDIELAYGQAQEVVVAEAADKGKTLIEVKSDRRAHETGNIFVELSEAGHTSGLMASAAHWIVYDIAGMHGLDGKPKVLVWFEREDFISRLRKMGLPTITAGDGGRVRGLKVPLLDALGIWRE